MIVGDGNLSSAYLCERMRFRVPDGLPLRRQMIKKRHIVRGGDKTEIKLDISNMTSR
jgi:hypothetical protein